MHTGPAVFSDLKQPSKLWICPLPISQPTDDSLSWPALITLLKEDVNECFFDVSGLISNTLALLIISALTPLQFLCVYQRVCVCVCF